MMYAIDSFDVSDNRPYTVLINALYYPTVTKSHKIIANR